MCISTVHAQELRHTIVECPINIINLFTDLPIIRTAVRRHQLMEIHVCIETPSCLFSNLFANNIFSCPYRRSTAAKTTKALGALAAKTTIRPGVALPPKLHIWIEKRIRRKNRKKPTEE
jgi:hypothetical protein